eukprot:4043648-Prymnesium_polylepis.2
MIVDGGSVMSVVNSNFTDNTAAQSGGALQVTAMPIHARGPCGDVPYPFPARVARIRPSPLAGEQRHGAHLQPLSPREQLGPGGSGQVHLSRKGQHARLHAPGTAGALPLHSGWQHLQSPGGHRRQQLPIRVRKGPRRQLVGDAASNGTRVRRCMVRPDPRRLAISAARVYSFSEGRHP